MSKDLIKKHLQSLSSLNEDKSISGMAQTKEIQSKEKTVNKDGLKDMEKELSDYDKDLKQNSEANAKETKMVTYATDDQKEYHNEMEILNGLEMLRYRNEPNEEYKKRAIEGIEGSSRMGNNSEWANVIEKSQGFTGPTFGKDLVKRIKDSAKKRHDDTPAILQYGDDIEVNPEEIKKGKGYEKVAVNENKLNNKIEIKENKIDNKMKRLNFKKPFSDAGHALQLIPESYKENNKVFEMTDGNINLKIRWEGSLTEGKAIVLQGSDKKLVNEDLQKMKHLFNYNSKDTLGTVKGKDRITENDSFADILNKTKKLLMKESTDIESITAKKGNFDDATKSSPKEATKEIEGSVKKENPMPDAEKPTEGQFDEAADGIAPEAKKEIKGDVNPQKKDFPEAIKVKTAEFDKAGIKVAPEATKHIHLKENEGNAVDTDEDETEVEDTFFKADADDAGVEEKEPTSADVKTEKLPVNAKTDDEDDVVIPTPKKLQLLGFPKGHAQYGDLFIKVGDGELVSVPEEYKGLAMKNKDLAYTKIIAAKELEAENQPEEDLDEAFLGFGGDDKAAMNAKAQQFDQINAKLVGTKGDQTNNKQAWLKRAKEQDNFKGNFMIDRGVLVYNSQSSNPLQGKTGGSNGYGTANESKK